MSDTDQPVPKCLTALIACLDQSAAILDCAGRIVTANAAFHAWLDDLAPQGASGPITGALNAADAAAFTAAIDKITADGNPQTVSIGTDTPPRTLTLKVVPDALPGAAILCQLAPSSAPPDVRLQYLMDHLDHGIWDFDIPSNRFAVSPNWRRLRGLSHDTQSSDPGDTWLDDIHPDDRDELAAQVARQVRGESHSMDLQYRTRHADGHWLWILCRAKAVAWDANGRPTRILGTDADVTALKQQDARLLELSNTLALAIKASGVGVWEFDPQTNLVHWDDRMLEIYGITDGRNVRHGNLWETHLHPDDLEGTVAYSDYCQRHGLDFQRDYRIVRPDGTIRHIRSLAGYVAAQNLQGRLVGVNIDLTEDRERQALLEAARARLEYDSRHDALTGLANRRLLAERTAALTARATAAGPFAVLQLDLDNFKLINDALGHAAGDAVLAHVGRTLRTIAGECGLACRTGGDEFVILYETAPSLEDIDKTCHALIAAFATPYWHNGNECTFGVSIGCAIGETGPDGPAAVFVHADEALYAAKQSGRGCFRVHAPQHALASCRS